MTYTVRTLIIKTLNLIISNVSFNFISLFSSHIEENNIIFINSPYKSFYGISENTRTHNSFRDLALTACIYIYT